MWVLDYYHSEFSKDLVVLRDIAADNKISIISLLPKEPPSGTIFLEVWLSFRRIHHKRSFLFCYFFSALLDQSIHAGLRSEHAYFEELTKYPKFVGVLSSYYTNLHPALLLLAATLYTSIEDDEATAIREFRDLSDFFIVDYCDFLENIYPVLTGRLTTPELKKQAISSVLSEMSKALAIFFVPRSLVPFTKQETNNELYDDWLSYFRKLVNQRIRLDI